MWLKSNDKTFEEFTLLVALQAQSIEQMFYILPTTNFLYSSRLLVVNTGDVNSRR